MHFDPMILQPGPTCKPGARNNLARTKLFVLVQLRRKISISAMGTGFAWKTRMALAIFFIHVSPSQQPRPALA
jgi:hypothetical protein